MFSMCCGGARASEPPLTPSIYRRMRNLALEYGASFDDWVVQYDDENYRQAALCATPLHALATNSRFEGKTIEEEVQYLLSKGCNINAPGKSGMTPLLSGLRHGWTNPDLVQALLEAGADPLRTDDIGRGGLHLFVDRLDCGRFTLIYTFYSGLQEMSAIFKMLLRSGCNPNHVDSKGVTVSMRMRHAALGQIEYVWRSVLEDLDILDCVDLRDLDESVCTKPIPNWTLANEVHR